MEDEDDLLKLFCTGSFLLGFGKNIFFYNYDLCFIYFNLKGTSVMYPNALAASTENTLPITRASALGTYRFWRDSGYWIGGLFMGKIKISYNFEF